MNYPYDEGVAGSSRLSPADWSGSRPRLAGEFLMRKSFTPGPWVIGVGPHKNITTHPTASGGCEVICDGNAIGRPANARLIVTAPEMLRELEKVQNWLREYISQYGSDPMDGGLAEMHNDILAVVAKAKGGAA